MVGGLIAHADDRYTILYYSLFINLLTTQTIAGGDSSYRICPLGCFAE